MKLAGCGKGIVAALRRQSGVKKTLRVLQKFSKEIVAALRRQLSPQITGLRITEKLQKYNAGGIES